MPDWKSSVLNFHDPGDEECASCLFVAGDRRHATLMAVIKNLDALLADKEDHVRSLHRTLTQAAEQRQGVNDRA